MKKNCVLFLALIFISFPLFGNAQRALYNIDDLGIFSQDNAIATAQVNCDSRLKVIENNLIEANRSRQSFGYSVQIYFGSGSDARQKAEDVKKKFLTKVDNQEATIVYEPPYFKVRAGNCRTKLEATKLKRNLASDFPGCFIVECKIDYPNL